MFCGEKSLSIGVKNSIKNLVVIEIVRTFAPLSKGNRALSSAGSERLPYKQRVGGSNPSAPTNKTVVFVENLKYFPFQ